MCVADCKIAQLRKKANSKLGCIRLCMWYYCEFLLHVHVHMYIHVCIHKCTCICTFGLHTLLSCIQGHYNCMVYTCTSIQSYICTCTCTCSMATVHTTHVHMVTATFHTKRLHTCTCIHQISMCTICVLNSTIFEHTTLHHVYTKCRTYRMMQGQIGNTSETHSINNYVCGTYTCIHVHNLFLWVVFLLPISSVLSMNSTCMCYIMQTQMSTYSRTRIYKPVCKFKRKGSPV